MDVANAAVPLVSWLPEAFTPGRSIFAEPLKLTPPSVLAVSNVVAVAAFPLVSWLPEVFTPGRSIFAEPLNETPPIFLAVWSVVAVVEFPFKAPIKVLASKSLLFVVHLSFVSSHKKETLSPVPRSTSKPAFCEGVPVSSEFNTRILSPIKSNKWFFD